MSSSVLELLEESSDELPRISDLETEKVSLSDEKDKNEIVISSDDEVIEISSEEQLPSLEKTQNNNRKPEKKIYLRAAISRPCKKLVDNVNDSLERVGSIYQFTTYYKEKNVDNNPKTVENMNQTDVENKDTNSESNNKNTISVKEIQALLQERKVP